MSLKLNIGKKNKAQVVIYFDQDILKLMVKNTAQNDVPAFIGLFTVEGKSDQEISDLIKLHLGNFKSSQNDFILALPRNLVTVKNVTLPSSHVDEIESMMEFQVPRLVPYPRSEIIYDYQLLSVTEKDSIVRMAVVHRKAVDKYFSILSKANIFPSSVRLCSDAVHSTVFEKETAGSFLEIDYAQSHWVFFEGGKIRFSRSVPIGAKDLLREGASEEMLSDFLNQVEASISLFLTEQSMADTTLHLIGASKAVDFIEKSIQQKFKLKVLKHAQDIQAKTYIGKELSGLVSLLGLYAFLNKKDAENEFDLTPKDIRTKLERRKNFYALRKLGMTAAGLVFLGAVVYANEIRQYQKQLDTLNQEIKAIQSEATELEDLKRKAYLLKYHVDHRGDCLDIFSSLLGNIPEDVFLKTVALDSNKVSLKGYASNLSKIFELTSLLQKNTLFNKIDTQYARQGESGRQEMAEFHLECWLKSEIAEKQSNVQSVE